MTGRSYESPNRRAIFSELPGWASVLAGGLLGSAARALVSVAVPASRGSLPVATLIVNLSGSALLGFYLSRRQRAATRRWALHFWAIGALGSLTTFSTFSLEVFRLVDAGAVWTAIAYVVASTLGGLGLALIGSRIGRVLS